MSVNAEILSAPAESGLMSKPETRAAEGWLGRFGIRARSGRRKVKKPAVVAFVRHLATLLTAGLPLARSLRTVALQMAGTSLGDTITFLAADVEGGEMLSSAMAKRNGLFDTLAINVVRAGEVGGTLVETLQQLADDMEQSDALRRTVLSAMVYPAIVMVIATLVVGFLLFFVVPTFEDVYIKMKVELPLITRLLLGASRLALRYWWAGLLCVGAFVAAWKFLKNVPEFQEKKDKISLRLPVFGKLRRKAIAARFLGTFATLIGSGVSILESLSLMASLTNNSVVRKAIDEIRDHVSRGGKMSEQMAQYTDLFSPMAIQMVNVGEETGSLTEAASKTAGFLNDETNLLVGTLTTLIEPCLTVGLGVVVGTIALAIYLPMFDMMKHAAN